MRRSRTRLLASTRLLSVLIAGLIGTLVLLIERPWPSTGVTISNLPLDVNKDDLRNELKLNLDSNRIRLRKYTIDGERQRDAYIQFRNRAEARQIQSLLDGTTFRYRTIEAYYDAPFVPIQPLLGHIEYLFLNQSVVNWNYLFEASAQPSDHVICVVIDYSTLDSLQTTQLGVRAYYSEVVDTLVNAGAAIIVFDMLFITDSPEIEKIATSFRDAGNVLIPSIEEDLSIRSEILDAVLATGANTFDKYDQASARPWLTYNYSEMSSDESLPYVAAKALAEKRNERLLFKWPKRGVFGINYLSKVASFNAISFSEIMDISMQSLSDLVRGRLVIIGFADRHDTPEVWSLWYPDTGAIGRQGYDLFGLASATETILENAPLVRASIAVEILSILSICLLLIYVLRIRRRWIRIVVVVLFPVGILLVLQSLIGVASYWIGRLPMIAAYASFLVSDTTIMRFQMARRLKRAMGFDPALYDQFRRVAGARPTDSIEKSVTILIADIRGYTQYSSSHTAGFTKRVVQEYLLSMEKAIVGNGGYINKFVGDEIVAVFGFPLFEQHTSLRAVQAALMMVEEFKLLRNDWESRKIPALQGMGIGIDSGYASFSEIGGTTRTQFDVIGDCINGASRLQGMTKNLPHTVLIAEEVHDDLVEAFEILEMFVLIPRAEIRGQGERNLYGFVSDK